MMHTQKSVRGGWRTSTAIRIKKKVFQKLDSMATNAGASQNPAPTRERPVCHPGCENLTLKPGEAKKSRKKKKREQTTKRNRFHFGVEIQHRASYPATVRSCVSNEGRVPIVK